MRNNLQNTVWKNIFVIRVYSYVVYITPKKFINLIKYIVKLLRESYINI